MPGDLQRILNSISSLRQAVLQIASPGRRATAGASRWIADAAAAEFHLQPRRGPALTVIIGGTGTGKSTLLNRLLEQSVSATSFRRTFTGGAVAAFPNGQGVPSDWLGIAHEPIAELPARGQTGTLAIAPHQHPALSEVVLVDTPDLDGDHPAHHTEADRAFRWAEAVVFVVSPEKYQMAELLPYYRMARRYAVPAVFVLNKCEEAAVLEDYRSELERLEWPDARVFVIARDDAGYEPPAGSGLSELRQALPGLTTLSRGQVFEGVHARCVDLFGRLTDQVLSPLQTQQRDAQAVLSTLKALRTPADGIDVSPLTEQLQRRMQEQSVLYLMGPGRVLERVRALPGLLARLPRSAWDVVSGRNRGPGAAPTAPPRDAPDFRVTLSEQFTIVQSRIDDLLRSGPLAGWLEQGDYAQTRLDTAQAAQIADEELAELKRWLEQQWQAKPRDTRVLHKVLKMLPGGERLTQWSEAAPYLLAIIVATHHAFFGPLDLAILASYGIVTWFGERATNEVTSRTRETNRRMAERFDLLAREQVDRVCAWIERQIPPAQELRRIERLSDDLAAALGLS